MEMNLDFLKFSCRPYDMTGFQGEHAVLDWFKGVFPEFFDPRIMTDCEVWERYLHYDFCIAGTNRILIFYDRYDVGQNKGVNVSVPSSGLWIIKEIFGFNSFIEFLFEIQHRAYKSFKLNWTRIDLCFDDYDYREDGHFTPLELGNLNRNDQFITKSQFLNDFMSLPEESQIMGGTGVGWTFYLGSRRSGRYMRVYDKLKESTRKRRYYLQYHGDNPEYAPEIKDCVRYEFEIKSRYANNLVSSLLEAYSAGKSYYFKDFVDNWFRIADSPVDHTHTTRMKTLEKWEKFTQLGFCEEFDKPKLFVAEKKPISYIDQQNWLLKAVLPALATRVCVDGSLRLLQKYALELIKDDNLPPKYCKMINEVLDVPFSVVRNQILDKYDL